MEVHALIRGILVNKAVPFLGPISGKESLLSPFFEPVEGKTAKRANTLPGLQQSEFINIELTCRSWFLRSKYHPVRYRTSLMQMSTNLTCLISSSLCPLITNRHLRH